MHGEVHSNYVFYKQQTELGHRYRQISVVEKNQNYEVRIFEGAVIQNDPKFITNCTDAEVLSYPTLQEALAEAEAEFQRSKNQGWIPYTPGVPRE